MAVVVGPLLFSAPSSLYPSMRLRHSPGPALVKKKRAGRKHIDGGKIILQKQEKKRREEVVPHFGGPASFF